MKVTVKKVFADKYTLKMYSVGDVLDLPADRANDIVDRGLASPVEVAKAEPKAETKDGNKKKGKNVKQSKAGATDID